MLLTFLNASKILLWLLNFVTFIIELPMSSVQILIIITEMCLRLGWALLFLHMISSVADVTWSVISLGSSVSNIWIFLWGPLNCTLDTIFTTTQ